MENQHGFREISRKSSDILNAELIQYEHEKSGARLAVIKNDDKNKVFQIGFRTPSDNSTGIAHIMEHSTLCGSRKYPVKEPFVELAKGSLNTFLNAMTYPDKTVYPIASTNDKDFRNLEDVYLDAVFYPNIYDSPYTLMQEGWRYEIDEKDAPLRYNGVVFNEMKGVFSDPEEILDRKTYSLLFPDTIYGEESGGDPDHIPELTYEQFINFHKKFYHPSNSWIYLYGDIDLDEQLEYLDSWLKDFDRIEVDSEIKEQAPFEKMRRASFTYPVNEESDEPRDYLSLNWVLPAHMSLKENLMYQILTYALMNSNAAPLKRAILKSGVAKDVSYSLSTPLLQPVFSIELKGTRQSEEGKFIQTVYDELEKLSRDGIDKMDVEAAFNVTRFRILEVLGGETGLTPRGLLVGLELMESWLYQDNAFTRLSYEGVFDEIKQDIQNGALEKMIKKDLIDNTHVGLVALLPEVGLLEKKEKDLAEKLEEKKRSMSEDEIEKIIEDNQELRRRQEKEDSPEALATIPRLSVKEIDRAIVPVNWEEERIDGVKYLEHLEKTKGLIYLDLIFDAEYVPSEDIPVLSLINKLTGRLGTENMSFEELLKQTNIYTGGISSSFETNQDREGESVSSFSIHAKLTKENLEKTLSLLEEMLLHPMYDEKGQIKNIVSEVRIGKQQMIQNSGNAVAAHRIGATYSDSARLFEEVGGIAFYDWISELEKNYEDRSDSLSKECARVIREAVNRDGLTVSITCEPTDLDEVKGAVEAFVKKIPQAITEKKKHVFCPIEPNEAFATAGQVQYNALGASYKDYADYSGAMQVAKTLLSMDYLWNKIRVKGGAYGAGFTMNRDGDLFFTSYRDPKLADTYKAYEDVVNYLKNLDLDETELEKYIIGTISPKETPLSPSMRANLANTMSQTGLTNEMRSKEREEILDVKNEDLRRIGDVVEKVLQDARICTIGSEPVIRKDQEETHRFRKVRNIG